MDFAYTTAGLTSGYYEIAAGWLQTMRDRGVENAVVYTDCADGAARFPGAARPWTDWVLPYWVRWMIASGQDWSAYDWVMSMDNDTVALKDPWLLVDRRGADVQVGPPPGGQGGSPFIFAARGARLQSFAREVMARRLGSSDDNALSSWMRSNPGKCSVIPAKFVSWIPEQRASGHTVVAHLSQCWGKSTRYHDRLWRLSADLYPAR